MQRAPKPAPFWPTRMFSGTNDFEHLLFGDIQANGMSFLTDGSGLKIIDFSNPRLTEDDVRQVAVSIYASGTPFFLATLVTTEPDVLEKNLKIITAVMKEDVGQGIMGIHLEGPCLDPECKGAHRKDIIENHPPSIELAERLYNACKPDTNLPSALTIFTMSPNYETSAETIRWLTSRKVVVSLGHFRAKDWSLIDKAMEAGAAGLTHFGNAFSREPEDYGAKKLLTTWMLGHERTIPNFVGDRIHTDDEFLRETLSLVARIHAGIADERKPVVVTSDLSPLAGAPLDTVGTEIFHGMVPPPVVEIKDGTLRTKDLSGSCHTLPQQLLELNYLDIAGFKKPNEIFSMAGSAVYELLRHNILARGWSPNIAHLRRCQYFDIASWQKFISEGDREGGHVHVLNIHEEWAKNGNMVPTVDDWLRAS